MMSHGGRHLTIIPETDKQEVLIKKKENNIGIKNLENKKSKSNFI